MAEYPTHHRDHTTSPVLICSQLLYCRHNGNTGLCAPAETQAWLRLRHH